MTLSQSEFEELFKQHMHVKNTPLEKTEAKVSKSYNGASLDDFISMVTKVCGKSLKKHKAVFIPDEGAIISDPQKKLENTTVLYQVVSRVPHNELKPRPIETIIEDIDDKENRRFGQNWSQRQDCIVQFDIVACDYMTANEVMSTFEDAMTTYTGYFKSKGVAEIYFKKYYTDKNLDKYRQWLSVRSIQYFVEIEKLTTVFDTTIEDIEV